MSNKSVEEKGIRIVKEIVREKWLSDYQEFDQRNDDGIDGVIFMRIRGKDTGGIIYVQVKCGEGYKQISSNRPDHIGIKLGKEYIQNHKPRWEAKESPVILIYIDPKDKDKRHAAYWVNLKSESAYTNQNKNIILIPKNQRFSHHSKGEFLSMSSAKSLHQPLKIIEMSSNEISIFNLSDNIKKQARKYYKSWSEAARIEKENPNLGQVIINRIGWRHITRTGRKPERIIQSWLLLPVAKKIITSTDYFHRLGCATKCKYKNNDYNFNGEFVNCIKINDYIGLRAKINFPHRDSAIIQVVLRRMRVESSENPETLVKKIWFYSVYEKRKIFI